MARVARVAAITYALLAVVIVGFAAKGSWDETLREQHPKDWAVTAADGRHFIVAAAYEYEAQDRADDYTKTNRLDGWPADGDLSKLSNEQLQYLRDHVGKRGDELPVHRLSIDRYAHPRSVLLVVKDAAVAAIWCGLAYIALWVLFRALRWVTLGFLERTA